MWCPEPTQPEYRAENSGLCPLFFHISGPAGIACCEVSLLLGQIVFSAGKRRGTELEETCLHGLPVLRMAVDPEGFWAGHRLHRAAKKMARAGVRRVLVPEEFGHWEKLEQHGLGPVDPCPFLRANAAALSVAALKGSGRAPERSCVALRALKADRAVVLAAEELCTQVRELCIAAPRGGEALRRHLRWEYGMAVRPDRKDVSGAVRFEAETWEEGGCVLNLFLQGLGENQVSVTVPGLKNSETGRIFLLAALWEGGKLKKSDLEFT